MSTLNIMWTAEAWDDYIHCRGQDKKTLKRINQLVEDAQINIISCRYHY